MPMEGVPEQFVPKASDWFSPSAEYVGRCKAWFSGPRGTVEGPGRVVVEETGEVWAEMTAEADSLRTEEPYERGLVGFLAGEISGRDNGANVGSTCPDTIPARGLS